MNELKRASLLGRLARSLGGNITIYQIGFSLPMSVFVLLPEYSEGTLTLDRAIYIVVVAMGFGLLVALFAWYAVMRPLIKRADGR
jgi:small-conductance mechanosensitive channel